MKTASFPLLPTSRALPLALAVTLLAGGCSKQAPETATATTPTAAGQQAAAPVQPAPPPTQAAASGYAAPVAARTYSNTQAAAPRVPAPPAELTIPAGTHIRITTNQELGSKISQPGQSFSATVASPIIVRGVTLVRTGSTANGTVIDAKSLGRFKGQALLAIRLDSVRSDGRRYQVETSTIERVEKGKGKRTAWFAGGGGGLGALIGGLAGGGKGALIGGLAGAGGGTAATAFTGNKEIVIPAETNLTFRLEQSVTVSR